MLDRFLESAQIFVNAIYAFVIMVAAIYFVISGGNEEHRKKAKKMLLYSTIAFVIFIFAKIIIRSVFFGI
ncbi:MAG: hypothetical protein WDZ39_00945 [Candidatus Spechtbacterales bacterium]